MRLITRCPACGTLFKVVPDQLRISEGWVRCGHCAEVFDATAHLNDPDAQPPAPSVSAPQVQPYAEPSHEEVSAPAADPSHQGWTSSTAEEIDPPHHMLAPLPEPRTEPPAEPQAQQPSDPRPFTADPLHARETAPLEADTGWQPPAASSQELPDVASTPAPHAHAPDEGADAFDRANTDVVAHGLSGAQAHDADDAVDAAIGAHTESPVAPETAEPAQTVALANDLDPVRALADAALVPSTHEERADASTAAPTFVRQAERREFWRRPAMRAALLVLLIVALAGFVVQVAYTERDRIAAHVPAARPGLEAMCRVLRCEVGALRKIEAVVVDGSSFTRLRSDAYRLGIVLKNTASTDIAMPSVELTLTSLQGQTVLRRVLSPADMGASATLGAGAEWVGDLPLVLDTAEVAARVAGYTVLPFYP